MQNNIQKSILSRLLQKRCVSFVLHFMICFNFCVLIYYYVGFYLSQATFSFQDNLYQFLV